MWKRSVRSMVVAIGTMWVAGAAALIGCGPHDAPAKNEVASISAAETLSSSFTAKYCPTAAADIRYEHELVINDAMVVGERCRTTWGACTGMSFANKWSFVHLMKQSAGGTLTDLQTSEFILRWLNTFVDEPVVNGQKLEKLDGMRTKVIEPWRAASGCSMDLTDLKCPLDFRKAPFRLLSVFYRPDLRSTSGGIYGGQVAGQGRFVYGFLDAMGNALPATVIFEYALPAERLSDAVEWAKRWHALGPLMPGTPDFFSKLMEITDKFVATGVQSSPRHNGGSALLQVRTGQHGFGASPTTHEFREFTLACLDSDLKCELSGSGMQLRPSVTLQTPRSEYQLNATERAKLTMTLEGMESKVLDEQHEIPKSFLGGASTIEIGAMAFRWRPAVMNKEVRRLFALSTCNGCHFRETHEGDPMYQTGFHVQPDNRVLSNFLFKEVKVPDIDGTDVPYFEKFRRQCELQYLLRGNSGAPITTAAGRPH